MKWGKIHIILCGLVVLFSCGKKTNWRYTLDKNSTEPFGLYLAYQQLEQIFPIADKKTIYDFNEYVEEERGSKSVISNSLLVAITDGMYMTDEEVENLYIYVSNGGNVMLISDNFSSAVDSVFEIESPSDTLSITPTNMDSISSHQLFWNDTSYEYEFDMPWPVDYYQADSGLGFRAVADFWETNLMIKYIGDGQILFGNSPEMLTNYALLKNKNINYYERIFSFFSYETSQIIWFSKHTLQPKPNRPASNFMELLKHTSYRYAFFVLLAMAILSLFFESRRRQRIIPVVPAVTNDSLAFTETIGKLYYGQRDNSNLAAKMIQYYLEHIRTVYNIPTTYLNQEFAHKLARKINKSTTEIEKFVSDLNQHLTAYELSETEIKILYKTLKKYS